MAIWGLGNLLFALILVGGVAGHPSCGFPAIYSFGDNNSDTGEHAAMFADVGLPNGQTFFHGPSGRYSDGRVIIDFIAEAFGFPFLSAYLDSYKTNYRHGANFALGGSAIRGGHGFTKNQSAKSILPRPEEFRKSLFIIDVGQNDFAFDLQHTSLEDTRKQIPEMVKSLVEPISTFLIGRYEARHLVIHNIGPFGCLPYHIKSYQKKNSTCALDQYGCVKELNEAVQEFNRQLKLKIAEARKANPNATITYVDVYSAKYNLISNAKNLGFEDPMKFCCGSYNDQYIRCGEQDSNGKLIGTACNDPSKYISWDGIHYTDAANKLVAKHILNGSLSDPPVSYAEACRFEDPMKFCCGSYNDQYIRCGEQDSNGKLIGTACNDPSKYISWDGIHYTDAANKLVAKHILNGSLSDPPVSYAEACRI
ncbi:hypothetical protein TEA_027190 [Camellia sinensis var. sinensis]|uniref:Uncharacterized protein n=1 Tax=Camellia sinensis var. sinensis TaxID=542762 RepID=A0A4S4E7R8_CAMSN|nr:hypothetical protein TEA_027190 [Camellia sinensis var. sinensis]